MTPFRFGPPAQQLAGLYHPGAPGAAAPCAALLCNPFGQEAVRTHRLYRVLAERLARRGVHVLRFDHFGTGDSDGDDTEGHLARWRDGLLLAHRELQRRAAGAPVTWLGVRLGATLACMASDCDRLAAPPAHLVLWEPLTDGPRYLADMRQSHQRALASSYVLVPAAYRQPSPHEAIGFGLGDALIDQLQRLQPAALPTVRAARVTLISRRGQPGAATLAAHLARLQVPHRSVQFEHDFDWVSEEALNTALVPHDAVQLLAGLVVEGGAAHE